jgi:hypothetical protein
MAELAVRNVMRVVIGREMIPTAKRIGEVTNGKDGDGNVVGQKKEAAVEILRCVWSGWVGTGFSHIVYEPAYHMTVGIPSPDLRNRRSP